MKTTTTSKPLLPLGRTVITKPALHALVIVDVDVALRRHRNLDWGDVCDEDRRTNDYALKNGNRVMSVYHDCCGTKFWIITEADRSCTTVLLPKDY